MNNALGVIDNATAVAVANSTSPEQFMATFYDEINTANAIVGNNAEIATNHAMLMDIINNLKPREQYLINESGTVDINNILTNTDITADLNSFFDIQAFNDRGLPLLNEDNNGDIVKLSLEDSRAELHNILRKKGVRDSITQPVIDIPGYTLTATLKVNSQADTNIFYNQIGIDFSLVKNDTTDQPTTTVTQSFGYTDNLPKFIIKNSHTRIENLGNAYLNDLAFTQLPVPGDRIAYTDFKNSLPMNNHGQIINGSSVSKELLSSVMS
jgi:hypothetical protein